MAGRPARGRRQGQNGGGKGSSSPEETRKDSEFRQLQADKVHLGERLHQLAELSDLSSDVGTRELLESMLGRCMNLFACKSGSIFLYRPETEELELAVAKGPMCDRLLGMRQPMGSGVAGAVAKRQEGIFVEDIDKSEFRRRDSLRYDTNSFVCVPVVYRGELLGVLSLSDKESGQAFNAADVGRLLALAGFSAGTIRQSIQQERLRSFNIELHRRLDVAILRLQNTNQELARLKNFNESILTSIVLGVLAFDENYEVTFCNDTMRGILHLGQAGNADPRFRDLQISCDGLSWPQVLAAVVKEGESIRSASAEYTLPGAPAGANPPKLVLNLAASPLRDGRRKVIGGVVVLEDATDRVRMEKQLAAAERHAVIGKLAARVAHELNNPLDGILRFINLSIALKGADDPTREYLVECKRGLERMVGIVSSLLEFSRSTYPPQNDANLNDVIREAVRTLQHRADQQHVKVTFDLEEDLPGVRCGELVQVFLNLTKNAYDAMKGGGEFIIRSRRVRDKELQVTVTDTGCGIPPEIVSRVFDPFFTTKGPSEGTGLGLAICYDIIDKHGGKIAVESQAGKGTTFTVTIPVT